MSPTRTWTVRLALAAALAVAAATLVPLDWLWRVDLGIYDQLLRGGFRDNPPADILIVAIDDTSLGRLGPWPWPRDTHATVVDRLAMAGARAVVFNVTFADPGQDGEDERLAAALARSGRVVLPVEFEVSASGAPIERHPVDVLTTTARALGHAYLDADRDGLVRTMYMTAGVGTAVWPALPLAVLQMIEPARWSEPPGEWSAAEVESVAWVQNNRILIPFRGPPGHFRSVSAADVLDGAVPESWVRNAIVLVGVTAAGVGSQIATPATVDGRAMHGVELLAQVVDGLRNGRAAAYLSPGATAATTASFTALVFLTLFLPGARLLGALSGLALPVALSYGLLSAYQLWFTPAPAMAGAVLATGTALLFHRRDQSRLTERERLRSQAVLGSVDEAVITTDGDGRVDYVNAIGLRWLGVSLALVRARPVDQVMTLLDHADRRIAVEEIPELESVEARLVGADGGRRIVRASAVRIDGADGHRQGLVIALSGESIARWDSGAYDRLTGLISRSALHGYLARAIEDARGTGKRVAVVMLDIERLRDVNITLGTAAGDYLLRETASRLRRAVMGRGLAARVGGDEFGVVFGDLRLGDDAASLGASLLRAFDVPLSVKGTEIRMTTRLGASLFPGDGDDAETLLQKADTAMRAWAQQGARGFLLYNETMSVPARERLTLTQALQVAVEQRTLELAYQPISDLSSGDIVGVEALARWRDPVLGLVPPSTFVPLAEEIGLIDDLGAWTLGEACQQVARWELVGLTSLWVSVNVSPRQFLQPAFPATVRHAVEQAGISPARLVLEVTETALQDVERAVAILDEIRALGVRVALDDFGVGYSSLSHLKQLPVDIVKLDRSFVSGLDADGPDRTICLAVLALAESLDRQVVAEGVETELQAAFLREKGCREIQGFFVSRPVEPALIPPFVRAGHHPPTSAARLPFA